MLFIGTALLIVGLGVGYSYKGGTTGMHRMPDGSLMSRNMDQHFIVQMIPHHEGAISMAEIALERSKRPEILFLANGIIDAQQREIDDMRSWYQAWFGSAPTGGMGGMHMSGMAGDVDVLKTISAAEFDLEFVKQMIPHHEMAIVMAQMLQASTDRREMKQLSDNIITSQSREIEMMRGWVKVW